MLLNRETVIAKINEFLTGKIDREEIGWWAFDLLVEAGLEFEPGSETLLRDVLEALQLFHDDDPMMMQFYPERDDLIYYLRCLRREEMYRRKLVPHWKV